MAETTHKTYRIIQTRTATDLGCYEADSPEAAIAAMLDDAGCDDEPDEGLVATLETTPASLDELLELMRCCPGDDEHGRGVVPQEWVDAGLPVAHGRPDWTSLPNYGGEEPDTDGVWSWDADRLLVGSCADDLEIVTRTEWCAC